MKVVIYQRTNGKWYYNKDTLIEQMRQEDLEWEVEYLKNEFIVETAKIVEIPDLPDPNTLV